MKDPIKILSPAILSGKVRPLTQQLVTDPRDRAVHAIDRKHDAHTNDLGNPLSEYVELIGDYYRYYEFGMIYYSSSAKKAFEVHGEIYKTYRDLGDVHGNLGAPSSDEFDSNNGWLRQSNFFYNLIAYQAEGTKVFSMRPQVVATWNPNHLQIHLSVGVKGRGFTGSSSITLWTKGFSGEVDATPRLTFNSKPDGTFDAIFSNFSSVDGRPRFRVQAVDPASGLIDGDAPLSNEIMAVW